MMMNMGSMAVGNSSRAMFFSTDATGATLLFESLHPSSPAAIFGVWFAIFFTAVTYRALIHVRGYVESKYWLRNRMMCKGGELEVILPTKQPSSLGRDFGRSAFVLITSSFGYILMLIIMTLIVPYFFAVVVGLAVGELLFARLAVGYVAPPYQ